MVAYGVEQVMAFVQNVSCPLTLFDFKDSQWEIVLHTRDEQVHKMMLKVRKEAFEIYQKNCRSFELIEVEGRHHAHLDHPEVVAAKVNHFLKMVDNEL